MVTKSRRQERKMPPDQPVIDTTPYGYGKDDSVTDLTEKSAITNHVLVINGKSIRYTAMAGHLVTADPYSAQPAAKIFYVAFTAKDAPSSRPVTFFYNGGPGSSSVFLLLGSFGPRRIKTSLPHFTPPAPYALEHNQESLLDHTDLVFINPVGTGYSAAIAPRKNGEFWGVDEDARSIKQFIKRYLTAFNRWNSPKFLFGESYGTPRTCVLTWLLHEDGVDLNGVVLLSSVLDYSQIRKPVGLLPTLAAIALYHGKVTLTPRPPDLPAFMIDVETFARGPYATAIKAFPKVDRDVLKYLTDILGIPPDVLRYWRLDASIAEGVVFLRSLLQDEGYALGGYDGRVCAKNTGIAASIDPTSGANDPAMTAVGGVYTAMGNAYLNEELQFKSTSPFMAINDQALHNWNFGHVDPTGAQKGGSNSLLYTAGDLAAAMTLNEYLKVFSANGYYDAVTPFFQTILNFENMPDARKLPNGKVHNLTVRNYESGHMIYLDNASRAAMKADLAAFYQGGAMQPVALEFAKGTRRISYSPYRRRLSRTPY
jgi:carboxypeptidase C (cathepsin A)